jgi:hypothetical protein
MAVVKFTAGAGFLSSPLCPVQLWFLFRGTWDLFQKGKAVSMKLMTTLHQVLRLKCGTLPPLPQYAFMPWCLGTGETVLLSYSVINDFQIFSYITRKSELPLNIDLIQTKEKT